MRYKAPKLNDARARTSEQRRSIEDQSAPREPRLLFLLKALLLAQASCFFALSLVPSSTLIGVAASTILGAWTARRLARKRLRFYPTLLVALGAVLLIISSSLLVSGLSPVSAIFGARGSLILSDLLLFIALSGGGSFWLRWSALHGARGRIAELIFVLVATIQLFAAHREFQLHEPRFFADWALINGHDLVTLLRLWGGLVAFAALVLTVRVRRTFQLPLIGAALALVFSLSWYFGSFRLEQPPAKTLTFGGGKGGGGGEGARGEGGGGGGGGEPPPPRPVAVALFHDEYQPELGLLYFRQQVLSRFDGVKLVEAEKSGEGTRSYDRDVLVSFPRAEGVKAPPLQSAALHLDVRSSMLLLAEHSTPPALSHATSLKLIENPDPRRFLRSYEVQSLVPSVPAVRLVGRRSVPESWSAARRAHYLAHPDDPRYRSLSDELTRALPPTLAGDDVLKAYAIKSWLEREGFYSLSAKHRSAEDPAGAFLFGSLRGYCVHFAHSAVHLLRSQGIAARVALGYAVDMRERGQGSAVLITSDRAHAWPELHLEGVGWVTFDIYPERSDQPPPKPVSASLESILGELARGKSPLVPGESPLFSWALLRRLLIGALFLSLSIFLLALCRRLWRALRPRWSVDERLGLVAYLATLDLLSSVGARRRLGESRETHALRCAALAPTLPALTEAHLRWAFGPAAARAESGRAVAALSVTVQAELYARKRAWLILGWLNPLTAWLTR